MAIWEYGGTWGNMGIWGYEYWGSSHFHGLNLEFNNIILLFVKLFQIDNSNEDQNQQRSTAET